jgi:hypothetical protein
MTSFAWKSKDLKLGKNKKQLHGHWQASVELQCNKCFLWSIKCLYVTCDCELLRGGHI